MQEKYGAVDRAEPVLYTFIFLILFARKMEARVRGALSQCLLFFLKKDSSLTHSLSSFLSLCSFSPHVIF